MLRGLWIELDATWAGHLRAELGFVECSVVELTLPKLLRRRNGTRPAESWKIRRRMPRVGKAGGTSSCDALATGRVVDVVLREVHKARV